MIVLRAIVVLMLLMMGACNRGAPAPPGLPPKQVAAPDDSIPVTGVDARVAPVFRLVRAPGGVRAALDSLTVLAATDEALDTRGHEIAHALGRFAMGERRDLAVLRECTPVFQSGCFHGALEGFFLQGGSVDRRSVGAICGTGVRGRPGYEVLECWHGLGHGLMVHFAGDVQRALPLCDALRTAAARRECADGIFMERAIRAVGTTSIHVGSGPAMGGAHAGHGEGAHGGHPHGAQVSASPQPPSKEQLRTLCGAVDARHQPSCWAYQPIALFEVVGYEPAAVLSACDAAPATAVHDCYQGFGKQYLGAMGGDAQAMIRGCQQGNRAYAADCMLGGVEYFTDLAWEIQPGIEFCGQVPASAKPACYGLLGRRLALVHPRREQAQAACRALEAEYVRACLAGAARES